MEINDPYYEYIYNLVDTNDLGSELLEKIGNPVHPAACWITFSEGDKIGKLVKEKRGYYPWRCYITDSGEREIYNGIPVYSYEEAVSLYGKLDIIVESELECESARRKISISGMTGECIYLSDIKKAIYEKQYFDFFKHQDVKETFVDGGAFDLGSTEGFISWCGGNYGSVFAFEPEKEDYEFCKGKMNQWDRVHLFNCGLFDSQGKMGFCAGLGGASRIENQEQDFYSNYDIEVTDLDSVVKGEKITFIKMDIEGAEEKALLGAKRTITEQKPKLAICVYHKPEDVIELPSLVLGMRPDYKIAFRHYSLRGTETVMYAW